MLQKTQHLKRRFGSHADRIHHAMRDGRQFISHIAGETIVFRERTLGRKYRSFTLDQDIDDNKAEARFQDGALELSLPKKTGSFKKELEIH